MENVKDMNISFTKWEEDGEMGYTVYFGDDTSSGISVTGSTKEEVIQNLLPYLYDVLDELND